MQSKCRLLTYVFNNSLGLCCCTGIVADLYNKRKETYIKYIKTLDKHMKNICTISLKIHFIYKK